MGPRRDPCAHQLAHPWPLGCALGTTQEDGHTTTRRHHSFRPASRKYLGVGRYVCIACCLHPSPSPGSCPILFLLCLCPISMPDLTPLAYVAGTVAGIRNIRVFDGPRVSGAREIVSSRKALEDHHIEPLPLLEKETLGIMNGTAFSASVASLALHDAAHLALLAQVCTALRWHPHYLVCEYVQVYAHCSMIRAEA